MRRAAGAKQGAAAPRILLTGFAPFDDDPINSSWEVARALDGASLPIGGTPAGRKVVVVSRKLPCEFDRSRDVLARLIKRLDPDLVLCLGQANNRNDFSVERVAININDARIKDNAGARPIDTSVIDDAPVAYFSKLPIKAVVQAVRKAGIPSSVSQTAGTFVCNHVFFALMHLLACEYPKKRGGFIHLPLLPRQAALKPGTASLSLDTLVEATRIAMTTALSVRRDRRVSDGALD